VTAEPIRTMETGLRAGVPTDLVEWRIAVRCKACGSWLTDPKSVMAGIGPRCAQAGDGR
jgi:hypothetical protein